MKRIVFILLGLSISSSHAILGDLNLDGTVGFDDFFIFADNFGKSGPVDTLRVEVFDTTFVEQVVEVLDTTLVEQVVEIFDTTTVEMTVEIFDTTAVTIFDTMEVDITVEVFDTTFTTIFDTVSVVDPTPGRYATQNQIENLVDTTDPLNGMRLVDFRHDSTETRLGSGLERQVHSHMQVTFFEEGRIIDRAYLKPSGHILEEISWPYAIEVIASSEGNFEFWFEGDIFEREHTRYLYDSNMDIVEVQKDLSSSGSFLDPTVDFFSYKLVVFLDLKSDGTWDTDAARDEFSPRRDYGPFEDRDYVGVPGPFKTLTFTPVDFEAELAK